MVDGRFTEVACELTGETSPEEIRAKELCRLISQHLHEFRDDEFTETDAGIVYRKIYDDPVGEEPHPMEWISVTVNLEGTDDGEG